MYCGDYRYSNDTSTREWTGCTVTTGTQPTGWHLDYPVIYVTALCDRERFLIDFTPPKWWRWYDVFRTLANPKLLRLLDGARMVVRRVQERYPIGQRRKQKRRAYVQRLHAL